jgi:threonine dehydrogenase-like Zn-dependent dehydrogenase
VRKARVARDQRRGHRLRRGGLNVLQGVWLTPVRSSLMPAARLDRALQFGATHAVDGSSGDALDQIRALTAGRGADYVLEAAGNKNTFGLRSAARPVAMLGGWARSTSTRKSVSAGARDWRGGASCAPAMATRPRRDFRGSCVGISKGRLKSTNHEAHQAGRHKRRLRLCWPAAAACTVLTFD